ncbi:hypothetical protein E2C01_072933 [Portunus trituberculatus]|uniref:Uncharacterized protein n=1 Tax=Portunus trituberculatus TaxID=210409 RepID=A0A5B7IAA5_PORTR|nr:hypothetical protein [Portunus trituberculatus]
MKVDTMMASKENRGSKRLHTKPHTPSNATPPTSQTHTDADTRNNTTAGPSSVARTGPQPSPPSTVTSEDTNVT